MAGDGAQPFNGKLDEIALLKTALNDQEISNYAISGSLNSDAEEAGY